MKRSVISVVCALIVGVGVAMPTDSELAKSDPDVAAIVSDVEKREKGDSGKIAESLASLEGEASNAAERYLFRREAVLRFLRAGKCDRARDVLGKFMDEGDAASVSAIDRYVIRRFSFKEKRLLRAAAGYKEYEAFVKEVRASQKEKDAAANRLKNLEAAYAKNPDSPRRRNQLAMEYALRGNWDKATPLLVKAKGDIGAAAQAEAKKPDAVGADAVAIGDAWWAIEGKSYTAKLVASCRAHAATWYRKALTDESLSNLAKLRVKGRIEQVGSEGDEPAAAPSAKSAATARTIVLDKGVKMNFVHCPAGTFSMGWPENELKACPNVAETLRKSEVRISRDYWMAETLVTERVWASVMGVSGSGDTPHAATFKEVGAFLERFSAKAGDKMPAGCVVRLPTYAEYEYALKAGGTEIGTPFGHLLLAEDAADRIAQSVADSVRAPKVNRWGLRGLRMKGGFAWLADRVSLTKGEMSPTTYKWDATGMRIKRINWPKASTDPLIPIDSGVPMPVFLCDKGHLQLYGAADTAKAFIRLVFASALKDGK